MHPETGIQRGDQRQGSETGIRDRERGDQRQGYRERIRDRDTERGSETGREGIRDPVVLESYHGE